MIGPSNDLTSSLALDTKSLGNLKQSAKAGSPEALKGAATQFEAMFINMMMKSMREASPGEGMGDSEQSKMFTSMLDQQLSQTMAKRGVGLADMLTRQLSSQATSAPSLALAGAMLPTLPRSVPEARSVELKSGVAALAAASPNVRVQAPHVKSFQERLTGHAAEAERATGIPAKFMLGQAALETGWGKREIRNSDGSQSHNLFAIKAGPGWKGKVATAVTTEYINGVPTTRVEKFRAYASYAESFKDYARLITNNPRYEKVLAHANDAAGFARGLQNAGYATDPLYAAKLTRIIQRNLV